VKGSEAELLHEEARLDDGTDPDVGTGTAAESEVDSEEDAEKIRQADAVASAQSQLDALSREIEKSLSASPKADKDLDAVEDGPEPPRSEAGTRLTSAGATSRAAFTGPASTGPTSAGTETSVGRDEAEPAATTSKGRAASTSEVLGVEPDQPDARAVSGDDPNGSEAPEDPAATEAGDEGPPLTDDVIITSRRPRRKLFGR